MPTVSDVSIGRPQRPWSIWLAAARPRTLPAAIAPVVVGSALAAHDGHFDGWAATLCLLFALLIQIATNYANDYYDFIKGADTAARVGPRRAVAAGLVTPARMRLAMAAVFAAAFLIGLSLIAWGGPWLLVIGVASIACGIAYTGGPYPLAYLGLGDLFVFTFFGLIAVGATFFVQTGHLSVDALLGGVAIGALSANILLVNNYRDLETDAAAGKRTLVVRFGRTWARRQFIAAVVVALTMPIVFWSRGYGAWCLLPLLLAPMAAAHFHRLQAARTAPELIALLGDTGKLLAIYSALLAIGVVA